MTEATTLVPAAVRLDVWLWAARFFKTRSLAKQAVETGKVDVAGQRPKSSRAVRVGEQLQISRGDEVYDVQVRGLSDLRGPAPVAQQLYDETPESIAAREQAAAARRLAPEPAHAIAQGRPTKRDRRAIDQQRRGDWGDRWSAALDE